MKPSVDTHYFSNSLAEGIELAHVKSSNNTFPRHFHDHTYSIGLMDTGAAYCLRNRDDSVLTSRKSTALINPGQIHTGIPLEGKSVSYRMIYISEDALYKLSDELSPGSGDFEFKEMISGDPVLRELFDRLSRLIMECRSSLEMDSTLLDITDKLLCRYMSRKRGEPLPGGDFSLAREILSSQLERNISLEDISRELGISRYQFLRGFKKHYGITPHSFRIQKRVEKAAQLIRRCRDLSDAALETGFSDQSHFTRTFKNYTGATPFQYANRN